MKKTLVTLLIVITLFSTVGYGSNKISGYNFADILLNGELSLERNKDFIRKSDGKELPSTINWDGTTYVPLRLLSELLSAKIGWNGSILIDTEVDDNPKEELSNSKGDSLSLNMSFDNVIVEDLTYYGDKKKVYFEADPSKGFNYPYVIILPDDEYKYQNNNHASKNYLMVETNNFGERSLDYLKHTIDVLDEKWFMSYDTAIRLHSPTIIPIFPRTGLTNTEGEALYEHTLNRYTVTIEEKYRDYIIDGYTESDIKKSFHLEDQLNAMIEDAKDNLQDSGWNVEEKVFMYGWSASGKFSNRYSLIYPEQIKAVYSGAMGGTVHIPAKEYNGMKLPYTVGTYDFEKLFNKEFDLEAYNKMAKMFYHGGKDENDVYSYKNYFSKEEVDFIDSLGDNLYPARWENTQQVFSDVGGKGMFLVNLNKGHGRDISDESVTLDFFMKNRDSESPVYPKATGYDNLVQNIYE